MLKFSKFLEVMEINHMNLHFFFIITLCYDNVDDYEFLRF